MLSHDKNSEIKEPVGPKLLVNYFSYTENTQADIKTNNFQLHLVVFQKTTTTVTNFNFWPFFWN